MYNDLHQLIKEKRHMKQPFITMANALAVDLLISRNSQFAIDIAKKERLTLEQASSMRLFRIAMCDAVDREFKSFDGTIPEAYQEDVEHLLNDLADAKVLGVIDGKLFFQSGSFMICHEDENTISLLQQNDELTKIEEEIIIFNVLNETSNIHASLSGLTPESVKVICHEFETISQQERDNFRLFGLPSKVLTLDKKETGFYRIQRGDSMNQCAATHCELYLHPESGLAIDFSQSQKTTAGLLNALTHAFAIDFN